MFLEKVNAIAAKPKCWFWRLQNNLNVRERRLGEELF